MASALHPDKQKSDLRADAEKQFLVIDRAYKVLSEPLLRQTYDLHGERVSLLVANEHLTGYKV